MTKDEEINILNSDTSAKTFLDIAEEFNLKYLSTLLCQEGPSTLVIE
jgi:hypothetical protein